MKRIDQIWAFIASDPNDDSEGLIGMQVAGGFMPFVCGDHARVEQLRPFATKIATEAGQRVTLKRFSVVTVEEVIEPCTQ